MADLSTGRLARERLLDEAALSAATDLLGRLDEDGIETVRVLFADQHGLLRGKTVVAEALPSVFREGLTAPSSLMLKDTACKTVFPVWSADLGITSGPMRGAGDMLLVPDPSTFRALPWAPHSAWLFCDPHFTTLAPIPFAPRHVLRQALSGLDARGWRMQVGLEVEFHILAIEDARLSHADGTMPPAPPETRLIAHGYNYLAEAVYDRLEPMLDILRHTSRDMGLPVRSVEVEMAPGQVEFTFDPSDPMRHADNMVAFRTMVKEVCARHGLHASFMCRPRLENAGSVGWHIHQSLMDAEGVNLFQPGDDGALTDTASGWIAGLLDHAAESCVLTSPTVNGYKRFQPYQLAPDRIQWGRDNRGAMIRALMRPGDAASRVENRVPDPTATPHYAFAAQILSGLAGIDGGASAPAPVDTPYDCGAARLPASLTDAIAAFEGGTLYRHALGDEFLHYISALKRAEWDRYVATVSEWEHREYFGLF